MSHPARTNAQHPYGEQASVDAGQATRRTDALIDRSIHRSVSLAPLGATLVLVLAAWTWASIPILHLPYTGLAWDTSLRAEGVAVLVTFAGLWLRHSPGSRIPGLVALTCGVAMIGFGVWAPHSADRGQLNELLTGAALIIAAVVAMTPLRRNR